MGGKPARPVRRVKWFGTNMYVYTTAANCAYVCLSRDSGVALIASMFSRPFHYTEDHDGVKPKQKSPFVGPKSKISEKLDKN